MRERRPPGKVAGQREGFAEMPGGRSRRFGIQKPHFAGKHGDDCAGLVNPFPEVQKAGQALTKAPGQSVSRFAPCKPFRDKKDIPEPPAADGHQKVGQDGMRAAAKPAEKPLDPDQGGGQVGGLPVIVAMTIAMGVVAGRTGDYLIPRMCGGCF